MKMQDAIERLGATSSRFQRTPFTYPSCLSVEAAELKKTFSSGGKPPPAEKLSVVASHIMDAVHTGQLQDIDKRDWRQAAWCLWLKEKPLVHDTAVREAYFGWLQLEGRKRAYEGLISAYLRDFDKTDASFVEVANVLAGVAAKFDWPWREKHKRFYLFSVERGLQTVAAAVISSGLSVRESLDEIGLMGDLAYQGFGVESFKVALALYRVEPTELLLGRMLEWSCLDNTFRFAAIRNVIANSLLSPWTDGSNGLPAGMGDTTRDFLLTHYQDPRLNQALWNGVDEDAKSVMLRWLAKASLEQFLQIVDDIASPELKLQWPFRRAFWEAYDRGGFIEEAWVAFAGDGTRNARSMFDGKLNFGNLDSSGVQHNHAVLILRLARLTIAEWSENGKCHIWLSDNENAPKLYQGQKTPYSKWQLTEKSNNGGVIHSGSRYYTWQHKVETFIRQNTGVRLNQSDYMLQRSR